MGISATALRLTFSAANLAASITSGVSFAGQMAPILNTLSGLALGANVLKDVLRVSNAIANGNDNEIADSLGRLAFGLAGAGIGAILGLGSQGAALGYVFGASAFDNWDAIEDAFEFLIDQADTLFNFDNLSIPKWWNEYNPFNSPPIDPIVFDLDGNGLDIIELGNSSVFFDLDGNGFAEHTAWIGPQNGFLVRDLNNNGLIDDITKLFGNATQDGISMLATYDSNADGFINSSDALWAALQVWVDANSNGITDAGELHSLESLNITSINLNAYFMDEWTGGGSWISHQGVVERSDGSTIGMYDVWFANNQMLTQPVAPGAISEDASILPNLAGYGTVTDLAHAMSDDEDLLDAVKELVLDSPTLTVEQIHSRLELILLDWTGASSAVPGSQGPYMDAKHLAFLEAIHGRPYWENGHDEPTFASGPAMEKYYEAIINSYTTKFLAQVAAAFLLNSEDVEAAMDNPYNILAHISYNVDSDQIHADLESMFTALSADALPAYLRSTATPEQDDLVNVFISFWKISKIDLGDDLAQFNDDLVQSNGESVLGWVPLILQELIQDKTIISGTATDDTVLVSGHTADIITVGQGNDTLYGGYGNDTYIYSRGDGHDTIVEYDSGGDADILIFTDINPDAITLERIDNDVTLVIAESAPSAGDGGSILLKDGLDSFLSNGVEKIIFANATEWTINDIRLKLLAQASTDGNDTIEGFNTADIITGGLGDDTLYGGYGNDTYIYSRGDGHDIIVEYDSGGDADQLIFTDINPDAITLERNGYDVTLVIAESAPGMGDGGSVLLQGGLDSFLSNGVEKIIFADETEWTIDDVRTTLLAQASTSGNDTIEGFDTNDIITGGQGDDILSGGYGNDTYIYSRGDGNDTIIEDAYSGEDTLFFTDIDSTEVTVDRQANNARIIIAETSTGAGDGAVITVTNMFNDGTGIERIVLADNVIWDRNDILGTSAGGPLLLEGTSGEDTIVGTSLDETLIGYEGDDILIGGSGSDTYIMDVNSGSDTIIEDAGSPTNSDLDVIKFVGLNKDDLSFRRDGDHLYITTLSTAAVLTVEYHFESTQYGVEMITFGNNAQWGRAQIQAAAWFRGTEDDDTIIGSDDNDTIDGGSGNDYLVGGAGSDTFVFKPGFGNDIIADFTAGTDIIEFDASIVADFASLQTSMSEWNGTTYIEIDANNTIT